MLALFYLSLLAGEVVVLVPVYFWLKPEAGSMLNVVVGSVGVLSMIAMLVYSIARRSKTLRGWMRLSSWLHLHIFLGLQGILLAYLHCMPLLWREGFPMLLNPGMLNMYALTLAFGSGVFGRYLFAQVPKTIGGQHMAAKEVEAELAQHDAGATPEVKALWEGAAASSVGVFAAAGARRRAMAQLAKLELTADVRALARRRIVLESQKAVMRSAQGVFRLWIVLHRPVAASMYLITFVHVALGLMFSPTLGL